MEIKATKHPLTVQYKEDGKYYNQGTDDTGRVPFDEKYLAVGESFDVPGTLVAVREHTGVLNADLDPSGGHGNGDGA